MRGRLAIPAVYGKGAGGVSGCRVGLGELKIEDIRLQIESSQVSGLHSGISILTSAPLSQSSI